MNMLEKYKNEIKKAGLYDRDSDHGGIIGEALERLVECHMKEGHSGFSHFHLVHLFHRLMTTNLLTPLQGTDDEWVEVAEENGKPLFQNNRRSSVFKCGDDIYDIDGGAIWEDKKGCHYTNKYSILHDIQFPYTPSKREVLPEIEWIKKDRLKKVDEFNKIGINDTYDFKYDLARQEIWMWATIADSENTISKDDYDHIVAVRGFEPKHIEYLNKGLEFIGISIFNSVNNITTDIESEETKSSTLNTV